MRVISLLFSRVDQEEGVVVTRTVTIDGNRQAQPAQSEVIRHTTMPTEIITKTITIEGDGGPLTAEELKEIMAQQGANFDTEVITTVWVFFFFYYFFAASLILNLVFNRSLVLTLCVHRCLQKNCYPALSYNNKKVMRKKCAVRFSDPSGLAEKWPNLLRRLIVCEHFLTT